MFILKGVLVLLLCTVIYAFEDMLLQQDIPLVISFGHKDCGVLCTEWETWIDNAQEAFPRVNRINMDVDYMHEFPELQLGDEMSSAFDVPNAVYILGEDIVYFNREYSARGVRRWLEDCVYGMDSPVFVGDMDGVELFRRRFNGSVEIVSDTPLYWASMKKLTSIGFAFRGFNIAPTYFVQSIFGQQHVFDDARHIFHGLIDTILPFSKFDQYDVQEVIAHYARSEIHVVQDGPLPAWWIPFARLYPSTLFVHYQPHEIDLPSPSVTVYNRSITYQRNATDIETVRWYHDVLHARATPHYRPSGVPKEIHPTVQEITGDTLQTYLSDVYLSLYTPAHDPCAPIIGDMSEKYMNETTVYGRFHTGLNDHEALDEKARAGFIIHFKDGVRKKVIRCIK